MDDSSIAPCLAEGRIGPSARRLVESARRLGNCPVASIMRATCVPHVFNGMEKLFAKEENPLPGINDILNGLADALNAVARSPMGSTLGAGNQSAASVVDLSTIEKVTADHYGQLFAKFRHDDYWEEPLRILKNRLERNQVVPTGLSDKSVLDAGCGGGRYTVAWKLLGAREATGLDISETNIADARQRVQQSQINGVSFVQGNVLDLPFASGSFDVVFSNGVLHHTTDWLRGVQEVVRVLKPGGFGWLYLIESPGGLFWDLIEVLRTFMLNEDRAVTRSVLHLLGTPPNRVFYMLDHVIVPINTRSSPEQVQQGLEAAGARDIRRLVRGTDFDRVERLFHKEPFAAMKYGVGENRFVFTK